MISPKFDMTCPACGLVATGAMHADIEIEQRRARAEKIEHTSPPAVETGQVGLCGECAAIFRVTDTGFELVTKDEFAAMEDEHRGLLLSLQRELVARGARPRRTS